MAPFTESSHTFQKLKLDTKAPHKPVASTFASIPRHDSQPDGSVSSLLNTPELVEPDSYFFSNGGNRRQEQEVANAHHIVSYDGTAAAVGIDDFETIFRKRQPSISFDSEVTLESGNRLSIEEPLPKDAIPETLTETSDGEDYSDKKYVEKPLDRRKRLQHHVGEPRYPLLQSTVDELATDLEYHDQDHVASLTSDATASTLLEEVQTPLEPSAEYLLSPLPATSPIELPCSFSRRNGSQRSKSYRKELGDGEGSIRRTSRRSSTRSGRSMSSMSPAASFLSRYKSSDGPLKATEPDDEGQGIGYHGEYIIGKQIGFGGFSVVKEVTTIENGVRIVHAVKIVRKQLKDKSELENEQIQTQFDHEVEIWRYLRHPYILPLLRVYNTEFATFCITRLNKGGTLFDLIRDTRRKKQKGLPSRLAKRYTYQLASALRYLHNDLMIAHRDIKLENCLLDMTIPKAETEGGDVLLCDFGMADFIVSDQRDGPEPHSTGSNQNIGPADTSTSVAGSLQYAAPELFNAPGPVFSPAADIWAFGVVVYALLTAQLPFNEGLDAKTSMKIQKGEWDVELLRGAEALQDGAGDAISLVQGCLEMDPEKRWTVNDILTCAWLKGCMQRYEGVSRSWLADS
ncbi:serine/threonine-protein kinase-like protein DCLK1 [Zopfia rhizophila CBS 207.26]|uniref:Serine/threonine-protein kinase-like protein DCLK1 n=1 Tax=Zopfia rhizophila CBS 207.26 TaxID=1314779 RepID=A0A6A6EHX3_9PEZI|nr:serine/threonine-protein kinase-like protein DCLK1 [Zopfia rhizophila CBS 207.26]